MIKKINGVQLLRKIPMKKAAKKCVFGLELAGALGGSGIMKNDTPVSYTHLTLSTKHAV